MEKLTYVAVLNSVLSGKTLNDAEMEKLTALRDSIAKKSTAERKPTATQTANASFKDAILDGMAEGHLYTITELMKSIPEIAELSNQRVSAIVRQLKDEGLVTRTEDKRKAYFSKVVTE